MKLTKENIYINLQGKSKEELTELYCLLKKNNEVILNNGLHLFIKCYFRMESECNKFHFYSEHWSCASQSKSNKKQEVTIQQLKEILQPMEGLQEFDLSMCRVQVDNEEQARQLQELAFSQGFEWFISGKKIENLNEKCFYFNTNDYTITHSELNYTDCKFKEIHFKDIFKTEPTLTEQLERAEAEVKRLKEAIEDNKIKVGDWCLFSRKSDNYIAKYDDDTESYGILKCSKIQDQELINKLNGLIK